MSNVMHRATLFGSELLGAKLQTQSASARALSSNSRPKLTSNLPDSTAPLLLSSRQLGILHLLSPDVYEALRTYPLPTKGNGSTSHVVSQRHLAPDTHTGKISAGPPCASVSRSRCVKGIVSALNSACSYTRS
jgi:hypothetical protein